MELVMWTRTFPCILPASKGRDGCYICNGLLWRLFNIHYLGAYQHNQEVWITKKFVWLSQINYTIIQTHFLSIFLMKREKSTGSFPCNSYLFAQSLWKTFFNLFYLDHLFLIPSIFFSTQLILPHLSTNLGSFLYICSKPPYTSLAESSI